MPSSCRHRMVTTKKSISSTMKEIFLSFPSMIWLTLFFLVPTMAVISYGARRADIIQGTFLPGYSLESLKTVFQDYETYVVAFRTVWMSVVATILCVAVALPVAYYMAQLSQKKQHRRLLLILLPFWSSFLVRIFAWKTLLHPEGIVKTILVACHFVGEATPLLYNNIAVLTVMIYSYLPFAILPLYSSAAKFDFQMIEAALDLGASRSRAFFQIFLPCMKDAIATACIMVLIPIAGAYIIPDVVGGVDSEMLGNKIAQKVFIDRNLPQASSYSLLLALILTTLVILCQKISRPVKERAAKKVAPSSFANTIKD